MPNFFGQKDLFGSKQEQEGAYDELDAAVRFRRRQSARAAAVPSGCHERHSSRRQHLQSRRVRRRWTLQIHRHCTSVTTSLAVAPLLFRHTRHLVRQSRGPLGRDDFAFRASIAAIIHRSWLITLQRQRQRLPFRIQVPTGRGRRAWVLQQRLVTGHVQALEVRRQTLGTALYAATPARLGFAQTVAVALAQLEQT